MVAQMTHEQLMAEALAAASRGDLAAAAKAFERAANEIPSEQTAEIAKALESVVRLQTMTNEAKQAAASLERLAKIAPDDGVVLRLQAELADKTGDLPARRAAWQAVADEGSGSDRVFALTQLGQIAREVGDHERALTQFTSAARQVDRVGQPLLAAEIVFEVAVTLTAMNRPDEASSVLIELDAVLPDEDGGMRARIEGHRGLISAGRGDLAAALVHGERARSLAVGTNNVMTYLAASTLIAGVHQQAGRLIDAYDTLVRARESLSDLLGPEGKELVSPAVQLFEQRLGPTEFQKVWEAWVAQRQAAQGSPDT
jgi:tetratricopeptide (TPR) repeat protein